MRETTLESLDDNARIALEKAQQAMRENFFHYAQALLFSLLDRAPTCTPLRTLIRQATVALKPLPANALIISIRTRWTAFVHAGGHRRPLKLMNDLERILADAPEAKEAHRLFARVALANGYPNAAILSLESLRILYPELTHEQILLARAYVELGQNNEAQAIVGSILEKDPHNNVAAELSRRAAVSIAIRPENWQTATPAGVAK